MIAYLNSFLDRVTIYRLALYYFTALFFAAIAFSAAELLPYSPIDIAWDGAVLVGVCYLFNRFFSGIFGVQPNEESQYITAFIIALITGPVPIEKGMVYLVSMAFFAMASKYFFALNERHVFNPAAIGIIIGGVLFKQVPVWWVGNIYLLPIIVIGGFFVLYKMRRLLTALLFFASVSIISVCAAVIIGGSVVFATLTLFSSPLIISLLFFVSAMFIEPMTSPHERRIMSYYAAVIAVAFVGFQYNSAVAPYALLIALLVGNLFSRAMHVDLHIPLVLKLKGNIANNTWAFWFKPMRPVRFKAGQFMSWELSHDNQDSRGARRYFTIASSPTEAMLMFATKFSDSSSTFKHALKHMQLQQKIIGLAVEGDFTLPDDARQGCVFIAGGIGITPFRSMIRYVLDTKQQRPIALFYSAKSADEIAFKEVFDEAEKEGWLRVVYTVTEPGQTTGWTGSIGPITADMIKQAVSDYKDRLYYISGPRGMVSSYKTMLVDMGIPESAIKTDYFPGYVDK